jgi:uncharacterized spore protein YtfJ
MNVDTLLNQARDALTVKRVFGDPIERDGVTVIPVANVVGGGGGGGGAAGEGAGFGMRATPAGMYVIKNGNVRWEPAFDLNRTILGGQIVAIVLFLTIRAIARLVADRRSEPRIMVPARLGRRLPQLAAQMRR